MKLIKSMLLGVFAVSMIFAQNPTGQNQRQDDGAQGPPPFEMLDTDKDGKITKDEAREFFKKNDRDFNEKDFEEDFDRIAGDDGVVDSSEHYGANDGDNDGDDQGDDRNERPSDEAMQAALSIIEREGMDNQLRDAVKEEKEGGNPEAAGNLLRSFDSKIDAMDESGDVKKAISYTLNMIENEAHGDHDGNDQGDHDGNDQGDHDGNDQGDHKYENLGGDTKYADAAYQVDGNQEHYDIVMSRPEDERERVYQDIKRDVEEHKANGNHDGDDQSNHDGNDQSNHDGDDVLANASPQELATNLMRVAKYLMKNWAPPAEGHDHDTKVFRELFNSAPLRAYYLAIKETNGDLNVAFDAMVGASIEETKADLEDSGQQFDGEKADECTGVVRNAFFGKLEEMKQDPNMDEKTVTMLAPLGAMGAFMATEACNN